MPFLRLCRGFSPVGFADSPPLVRGGSQLTMWRAYKAETKGR